MDFEERATIRNRRVSSQIALTLTLWEVVDRFAQAYDLSATKALERLLRQGLKREAEIAATKAQA